MVSWVLNQAANQVACVRPTTKSRDDGVDYMWISVMIFQFLLIIYYVDEDSHERGSALFDRQGSHLQEGADLAGRAGGM